MTVLVLADRGLYARWLFRAIVHLGWHPLLRVNAGGRFRPQGCARWHPLASFVPQPDTRWQGTGTAFKTHPLAGTLLACWEPEQADRWLLVTDLPPAASTAAGYGLRAWIEQGFKLTKRGGWQWQRTRMTDPGRAARLWLVVAVATLWAGERGGRGRRRPRPQYSARRDGAGRPPAAPAPGDAVGAWSACFSVAWSTILVALLRHEPLPLGRLIPEPWPALEAPVPAGGSHAF